MKLFFEIYLSVISTVQSELVKVSSCSRINYEDFISSLSIKNCLSINAAGYEIGIKIFPYFAFFKDPDRKFYSDFVPWWTVVNYVIHSVALPLVGGMSCAQSESSSMRLKITGWNAFMMTHHKTLSAYNF